MRWADPRQVGTITMSEQSALFRCRNNADFGCANARRAEAVFDLQRSVALHEAAGPRGPGEVRSRSRNRYTRRRRWSLPR